MPRQHSNTRKSRDSRCDRIAKRVCDVIFGPIRGSDYTSTLDDILSVIDRIPKDPRCPAAPMKQWGHCIAAVFSMKTLMAMVGVMGTNLQRQCKQAMTCSLLDSGHETNLVIGHTASNKKLLESVLPHLSWRRDEWIQGASRNL